MDEITMNVNWLAVGIGFVLTFFLGWLWYSPAVFGRKWAEGVGISMEDCPDGPPVAALLVQAIGTFLLAWVVGVTAVNDALLTMILILMTIVFLMIGGGLFSQKSCFAIAVEAGFVVAMVVVMVICQGVF